MSSADQTINIPQLILVLLLGGLAVRYFFFVPGSSSSAAARSGSLANNQRAREADVERVQQMFPQVPRRSIMWDLQRNGGNVVATTERILSGRGLEIPPQSFQPPLPIQASSQTSPSSTTTSKNPSQPDLITRYNLKAKLAEAASSPQQQQQQQEASSSKAETEKSSSAPQKQKQAWSANKGERQALLQRRREEMILAARKKMEAKVAAESAQGTSHAGAGAGVGASSGS